MANSNEFQEQIDILKETKSQIKQKLIEKGQEVTEVDSFRSYVDKMTPLIDTSDANASANNIAEGKTAYINGEKVTGNLKELNNINFNSSMPNIELDDTIRLVKMTAQTDSSGIIASNETDILAVCDYYNLGNAIGLSADKIKKGETIIGYEGTVEEGLDTSDATATSDDICKDKTAYINGVKVTGTVKEAPANTTADNINMNRTFFRDWGNGFRTLECRFEGNVLQRDNSCITVPITNPSMTIDLVAQMGVSADKIKKGENILGVEGTVETGIDTSDATSTFNDIAEGKTAYVNGEKIIGNVFTLNSGSGNVIDYNSIIDSWGNKVMVTGTFGTDVLCRHNSNISFDIPYENIATLIGLTTDKVKKGETILGIAGTYEGTAMKQYNTVEEMNNDIANIEENELVKVVAEETTYYIKETTMKKLVKEEDTLSPQAFTEAESTVGDILGEEE